MSIPEYIATELGEATVGRVKSSNATKKYLCPVCDEEIELNEEHLIVVPIVKPNLRRHIHTDCVEELYDRGMRIVLHPNEPNIKQYHNM
jgi:hypothetical protein